MRLIFIVADHIVRDSESSEFKRGAEEASQFAAAATTALMPLVEGEHDIHLFYYRAEGSECRGKQGEFRYPVSAFTQHGLDWEKLQVARFKQGTEGLQVYLNYEEARLAARLRELLASNAAALFIFAHGAGGGIALGRVENGAPNEYLRTNSVFGSSLPALNWKRLLIFHFHCYAGRFFPETVYQNAKAQKLLGLGISTDRPTQGHVMTTVAEECKDLLAAAVIMLEDGVAEALEVLSQIESSLRASKNPLLEGQEGFYYGGSKRVVFPIGPR